MSVSSGSSENNQEDTHWRGSPMSEIYRGWGEWELNHLPPVSPSDNHKVLYHCPLRSNDIPRPIRGSPKWDANHVRLSCSTESLYPITKSDGTVIVESRWELIRKALSKPITNSKELEAAILSYNSKYEKIWKFHALHLLFEDELTEDEAKLFFVNILPKMTKLALKLPELIQTSIPLLRQGQNRSISLSQQQISCLLANAFFCTFPRRNTLKKRSEYSSFPDINFNRLYQSSGQQVIEKIKCLCNYFRRVCNTTPTGVMTFTRRSMTESQLPNWSESNVPLGITPLHVSSAGTIEDQGKGLLQVDFANKFLGGGVLGGGCVQEEIRFVICPELIISKLFTEALKPCEALVMVGCEQFNQYKGYASSFTWDGNYEDITPFDCSRRRQCSIVAIDALFFVQSAHQYREELMLRELNKAYVGFYHPLDTPAPGVASGNWGCGAFGGDATLKALIQLMACTATRRPLVYYTFGNKELRDAIHDIHTFFIENNVTIKRLWHYLKEFRAHKLSPSDLYGFICQIHRDHKTRKDTGMSSEQPPPNKCSPSKKPLQNTMTNTVATEVSKKEVRTPSPKKTSGNKSTELSTVLDKSPDLFSPYKSPTSKKQDTSINKTTKSAAENRVKQQNAAENECTIVQSTSKSADNNENGKELRQKSLLEMLDWSYYKGSPHKRKRDTS